MLRLCETACLKLASFFRQWASGGWRAVWATARERIHPTLPTTRGEWLRNAQPTLQQLERMSGASTVVGVRWTIIVPVYNTHAAWLTECLDCVLHQTYPHWQCLVVDDCSTNAETTAVLARFADVRVMHLRTPHNAGVAAACNLALQHATGDYCLVVDHDDVLLPHALWQFSRTFSAHPEVDLAYSDEAITSDDTRDVLAIRARPAFSAEFYRQHPYFVHAVAIRIALLRECGGWNTTIPACHDVELILRLMSRPLVVAHIPDVLYLWRTHPGSLGHTRQQQVMATMTDVMQQHLRAIGRTDEVAPHPTQFNVLQLRPPVPVGCRVRVVILTKNRADLLRRCIDSVLATTPPGLVQFTILDHASDEPETLAYLAHCRQCHQVVSADGAFNFSRLNNVAVKESPRSSTHILFLNNDVAAFQPGWLEAMLGHCQGAVTVTGAVLLYPDSKIQHAGIGLGLLGGADHAYRGLGWRTSVLLRNPGENCELICTREVTAVTAACLLIQRSAFDTLGGFDEEFAVGFNDVDLCLRARRAGGKVLLVADAVLMHEESQSRGTADRHPADTARFHAVYGGDVARGDNYLSPLRDGSPRCDVLQPMYRWRGDLPVRVIHHA